MVQMILEGSFKIRVVFKKGFALLVGFGGLSSNPGYIFDFILLSCFYSRCFNIFFFNGHQLSQ